VPLNDKTRKKSVDKHSLFNKLCGLWENRGDITLESIRDKAWKRGGERGQAKKRATEASITHIILHTLSVRGVR
jgi:hypothetical protein